MHLAAVRVELQNNTPVVLLQEVGGARTLPIFIGTVEASAIAEAIQGIERARPMTHDLMRDLLIALGATVDRVVITDLVDSTYYAEIRMTLNGREVIVSSRPSDAMALAARMGTTIYAEDALLEENGVVIEADDEEDEPNPEELVSEFRQFIQGVRPEDFG